MIVTIGIDTGSGTAGIGVQGWKPGEKKAVFARAYQCDPSSLADLLEWILTAELANPRELGAPLTRVTAAGIEMFVQGRKGLKGTNPMVMRAQQADCATLLSRFGVPCAARTASQVKLWGTDGRLARAGLADVTNPAAMRHARDGQRHGLFCAVHDCGLPDPLSRKPPVWPGQAAAVPR
jgi:hypothetical protein